VARTDVECHGDQVKSSQVKARQVKARQGAPEAPLARRVPGRPRAELALSSVRCARLVVCGGVEQRAHTHAEQPVLPECERASERERERERREREREGRGAHDGAGRVSRRRVLCEQRVPRRAAAAAGWAWAWAWAWEWVRVRSRVRVRVRVGRQHLGVRQLQPRLEGAHGVAVRVGAADDQALLARLELEHCARRDAQARVRARRCRQRPCRRHLSTSPPERRAPTRGP
jgi:hypothetical protein